MVVLYYLKVMQTPLARPEASGERFLLRKRYYFTSGKK